MSRILPTLLALPLLAAAEEVRILPVDASPPPPGYSKRAPRKPPARATRRQPAPRAKPVVHKPGSKLA